MRRLPTVTTTGRWRIIVAAALLAVAMLVAGEARPAHAQTSWVQRTRLLERLAEAYADHPAALGLAANGNLIEVLTTRDGASWTILITRPDGVSCVVEFGEHWQTRPQETIEDGRGSSS